MGHLWLNFHFSKVSARISNAFHIALLRYVVLKIFNIIYYINDILNDVQAKDEPCYRKEACCSANAYISVCTSRMPRIINFAIIKYLKVVRQT